MFKSIPDPCYCLFIVCRTPPRPHHQRAQLAEAVSVGAGWTEGDFGLPLQMAGCLFKLCTHARSICLQGLRRVVSKTSYSVFEAALPDINNSFYL